MQNRRATKLLAFLLIASLGMRGAAGCKRAPTSIAPQEQTRKMFGTLVTIRVYDADRRRAAKAVQLAFDKIAKLDRDTNNYNPASQISLSNARSGKPTYVEHVFSVVRRGLAGARDTGGAFDPTILPVVELWGFGRREHVPSQRELGAARRLVGYRRVDVVGRGRILLPKVGMGLDLGGIAKGYAADVVVRTLRESKIRHAMVTMGSTTSVLGGKPDGSPWKIGIENPRGRGLIGVVSMKTGTVSTSGDYQNYFVRNGVRYHHIIDPKTGMPSRNAISVTVVGAIDATLSDVLSTALFVKGFEGTSRYAERNRRIGVVFVTPDGRVRTAGSTKGRISQLRRRI